MDLKRLFAIGAILIGGSLRADEVMVYRAVHKSVEHVRPVAGAVPAPPLPCELVIQPGQYSFHGQVFDLDAPGLYRFLRIPSENQQRIVFGGDVDAFMSALAWVNAHGNADDRRSGEELETLATTRKLSSGCGTITRLAVRLLGNLGVQSRRVFTFAGPPYNGFDDGHIMIEVFQPHLRRWVLYDLDSNASFKQQGRLLSFRDFATALRTDQHYDIESLGAGAKLDASRFEGTNGYSFVFYAELAITTETALRAWYERVCRFVAIDEGNYLYARVEPGIDVVLERDPSLRRLDPDAWDQRFYH